ncbi:MAG: hypothetical protein ACQGVC_25495 [Myxococcota bacterium]
MRGAGDSREEPGIYDLVFFIVVFGAMGHLMGLWHWTAVAYALAAFLLLAAFLRWLGGPSRYKGQRFSDFAGFVDSWGLTLDDGGRIFIDPESRRVPRLRFRVTGRGPRKLLRVRIPTRKATRGEVEARLEALAGPFEDVTLRGHPRSIEFRLPARAAYTGSIGSRAAEAAFRGLGCDEESLFTIHCRGEIDPYYDLEITEQAAENAPGWLKRFFERRARSIRSALPRRREPPGRSDG